MSKIRLKEVTPELDALYKKTLYSYEHSLTQKCKVYQIIQYGFEDLTQKSLQSSVLKKQKEIIRSLCLKYTYHTRDSYEIKLKHGSNLDFLKIFKQKELFAIESRTIKGHIYIRKVIPLKKALKSFMPSEYVLYLLLYVLESYDLIEALSFLPMFHISFSLKHSKDTNYSLKWKPKEVKNFETTFLDLLPEHITSTYKKGKYFVLPKYICYSDLETSFYHHIQKNYELPKLKLKKDLKKEVRPSFISFLECLDFTFYMFNHLNKRKLGATLLNPIGDLKYYTRDPFLQTKLKDLPKKGYTWLKSDLCIWDLESKKELKYVKKLVRLQGYVLENQELKDRYKVNYFTWNGKTLGFIKELKKGYICKFRLRPKVSF